MADEIPSPYRALMAAIIIRALQDVAKGWPCGERCRKHRKEQGHTCMADALVFLRGPNCKALLEALGLDPRQIDEVLAISDLSSRLNKRKMGKKGK